MSGQVRQLIDAIVAGDTITAMNTFNEIAAEKVAAKLEDKKIEVASGLFGESVEEEESEEDLNLEDFTPEEIQEFLDSEEGQQLDEISKQTLGNYLTKAIDKKTQLAVNNTKKATNDSVGKYYRRSSGIKTAIKKLAKD